MEPARGICPQCELTGPVGSPCTERACTLKRAHFIPPGYYAELCSQPHEFRDPQIGQIIEGHLLVGRLGIGGFGTVYLALQLPIMMRAALKLMNKLTSKNQNVAETMRKKFETEARSLAKLDHPNIVRLLRYGHVHDRPYMVMEYVSNALTLAEEVKRLVDNKCGFELVTLRRILRQLLSALDSAHKLGIIHRDIKPENIMLQRVDQEYFVRILDFGLSKFTQDSDQTSVVAGTPVYMAPEQITRKQIGPWTDLYAIAVMAFELLTGQRPYEGATTQQVFKRKLDPEYDACAKLPQEAVAPQMSLFFKKALAQDPEVRYRDVESFRRVMDAVLDQVAELPAAPLPAQDLTALLSEQELELRVDSSIATAISRPASSESVIASEYLDLPADMSQNIGDQRLAQTSEPGWAAGPVGLDRSDILAGRDSSVELGVPAKGLSQEFPVSRHRPPSPMQRWIVGGIALMVIALVLVLFIRPWESNDAAQTPSTPEQTADKPPVEKPKAPPPLVKRKPPNQAPTPAPEPAPKPAPTPKPVANKTTNKKPADTKPRPVPKPTPAPKPVVVKRAPKPRPATKKKPLPLPSLKKGRLNPKIRISIKSNPSGAQIFQDGRLVGKTPHRWLMKRRWARSRIVLKKKGFKDKRISFIPKGSKTYSVKLKPAPSVSSILGGQ